MHIDFHKRVFRDLWFITGFALAILFAITIILGPPLAPFDPWDMSFVPISSPSGNHILGINDGGQDIFSELLYAIRNTVAFGLGSGLVALAAGVIVGVIAGSVGGLVSVILMRLADVLLAIPAIMILILTAALFRPSPWILALILSGMMWPTISKAIRAQTLTVKESLHVKAAKQIGASNYYIIRRHLMPEMFPLYLIGLAAKARMAMFMEASLAFLGLFDPSRKSLGMMIAYAVKYYYMDIWWNWLLPPIVCLSLLIMTVTFLAISLEKVLDPRLKEAVGS
ncbi:MAG: ABC transporter permease [Deltaproteobacteria bacterium]|nr:ABC transporter permease [Deltaproteobacteria bacterium]